jgi:hypothetical protein
MQNQTLNNIEAALRDIADNHAQIHNFRFGKLSDFESTHLTSPVEMWCDYEVATKRNATVAYAIRVYILDLVQDDLSNETEVFSDTALICSDIESQLRNSAYPFFIDEEILTFNPVEEYSTYRWTGHYFTITLVTAVSDCGLPFIPPLSPPNPTPPAANCEPVTIRNIETLATVDTVAAGGTYDVLVFSGIRDPGIPPFTNSIIATP